MKKTLCALVVLFLLFSVSAHALQNAFLDMRNRIFAESKEVKAMFNASPDIVVVSAMWDTCLVAMSQLDAYFSMVQIFNTIEQANLRRAAVNTISGWLIEIKKTNNTNLELLSDTRVQVQDLTRAHMEKIKVLFNELNMKIDEEIEKLDTLSKLLRK